MINYATLLKLLLLTLSQAYAQSTYTNPVHNADFADPTVIRGHDGLFYAYATNTSVDNKFYNIQVALSSDLINWEVVGDALPQKPAWAASDFWAPHVLYDEGERRYYLYYSGESPDDKVGKCIGVAISERPTGPFIDTGSPLISGEGFTTIDPMAFDDPATGRKYLFWGSGHEPIKVRELNDDRISFKPASTATHVLPPNKDDYSKLVEGAWVHYRDGYYYLFYSGDNCCGDKANYAVMIARSKNVEGPFERLSEERKSNSSTILAKNKYWLAPGHNSVVTDDAGQDWIVYHAIALDPALRSAGRIMLVDPIRYKNGWPYLENNSPSVVERSTPSVKKNNSK